MPTLNPRDPLERRKKEAPEGPEALPNDKKGKKKADPNGQRATNSTPDKGMDPLEIAYGPMMGTTSKLTEDDFRVDDVSPHHPHGTSPGHDTSHDLEDDGKGTPVTEVSNHWGHAMDTEGEEERSPHFTVGGEEEFQNVWGR